MSIRTSAISLLATLALPAAAHAQVLRFDPHLDLPADAIKAGWTGLEDATSQFDLVRAKAGGTNALAIALFVPQGPRDAASLAAAQREFAARDTAIHAIADRNPKRAGFARSPADVRAIAASGRVAIVESLLNAWPLGDDVGAIDKAYAGGVRIFGFVHAGHNQYADSSRPAVQRGEGVSENGGLSPLGRAAVKRLNDLGVLIDVSQLSEAAFDQVLALSRAPVIASHSDVRAIIDNTRNLSDAQLDAIKAKGGVVAINAFSAYLKARSAKTLDAVTALQKDYGIAPGAGVSLPHDKQDEYHERYEAIVHLEPKAGLADFGNAVDYAVKRIGIEHVALSSDFNHGGGVVGWDNVGEAGNVTAELKRRGYADADIAKLWGGNVLRVWQAAIDARDTAYTPAR